MAEKIKVKLNGTAETMLQSFYARAKHSKSKGHKFYDAKAVERIDYNLSLVEGDSTMSNGVIARILVFDELVKDFVSTNITANRKTAGTVSCNCKVIPAVSKYQSGFSFRFLQARCCLP